MHRLVFIILAVMSAPAHGGILEQTPEETKALKELRDRKYINARTTAKKILDGGESLIATYVMGSVYAYKEGNFSRSVFLIRRSKTALLDEYGTPPNNEIARHWHKRILRTEADVLRLLDRRDDQLAVYDEHDEHYAPKKEADRIWPLMKLERFDEAREIGERLAYDENPDVRFRAMNGMMAVEEESGNREASYQWGVKAMRATRGESCVIGTNMALGARRTFRFQETIEFDQKALKAPDKDCPMSPHGQLAAMYLVFGEFQKSIASLKALREEKRDPYLKYQNESVIRARLLELLYALGAFEKAVDYADTMVDNPDRLGTESAPKEIRALTNHLLAWSVYDARMEQIEEEMSARDFSDGFERRKTLLKMRAQKYQLRRQSIRWASTPGTLRKVVRPYFTSLMPWFGGNMIEVFGRGVVAKAIDEAQERETELGDTAALFLKAFTMERHWRAGDEQDAIELGESLLKTLPKAPKLLRMRIRAILADAYTRRGQHSKAEGHFHAVLNFYPTVFRHLKIRIPIRIEGNGERSKRIAEYLADSPRFTVDEKSDFVVAIDESGDGISICLNGQKVYACGALKTQDAKDPEDIIGEVIDTFHNRTFSPAVELSQADISSLDGHAVRQNASESLDKLLQLDRDDD